MPVDNEFSFLFLHSSVIGNEPGLFDIVIVNDDLDESYEKLQSVLKEVSLKRG